MALPERIHRKTDETDYVLVDDEGNEVKKGLYKHWYAGKRYAMIWETKYSPLETPTVYEEPNDDDHFFMIHDDALIAEIADDFWKAVSQPLQTDGPAWYYENKRPDIGPMEPVKNFMGISGLNMIEGNEPKKIERPKNIIHEDGTWTCVTCNHVNSGRFCSECGYPKE
jgi:hypothetical protein